MITLTIINAPFEIPPSQKGIIVGPQGGSVGRSEEDNIVVIPDPNVSRHHFRIVCTQGQYCIQDTSSNGAFLNNASMPVGNGNTVPLSPGDVIKVGRTELRVDSYGVVESDMDALTPLPGFEDAPMLTITDAPNPSSIDHSHGALWDTPDAALPDSTRIGGASVSEGELGHLLSPMVEPPSFDEKLSLLDQFLGPIDEIERAETEPPNALDRLIEEPGNSFIPDDFDPLSPDVKRATPGTEIPLGDATFLAAMLSNSAVPVKSNKAELSSFIEKNSLLSEVATPPPRTNDLQTNNKRPSRPNEAPPTGVNQPASDPISSAGLQNALTPLLGDAVSALSEAECLKIVNELAHSINNLLPEIMESLQSRWVFKQSMHMNMTMIQRTENNPLKFSPTPETATQTMFLHRSRGYLSAPDALKESIQELQFHQAALIAAIKPAMMETIAELFSVQAIESQAAQHNSGFAGFGKKGKLWDSYVSRSNALLENSQGEVETLLMKKIGEYYSRLETTHELTSINSIGH